MIRTNSQRAGGSRYTRYLAHYAKKNYTLLALGFLFITGVFLGTLLIGSAGGDTMQLLLRVVNGYIEKRREQPFINNFISTFASSLLFVAILFICGFSAISQPVSVLAPLFRGLGFGFSSASLYASYGTRAAGFIAVLILPDMLASTLAVMLCSRESLRLSASFLGMFWNRDKDKGFYPLHVYMGRYLAAAVLCAFSAFLQSVLYFLFAKYFVLG